MMTMTMIDDDPILPSLLIVDFCRCMNAEPSKGRIILPDNLADGMAVKVHAWHYAIIVNTRAKIVPTKWLIPMLQAKTTIAAKTLLAGQLQSGLSIRLRLQLLMTFDKEPMIAILFPV
eukprot:3275054-Amphidinium_carterae.1